MLDPFGDRPSENCEEERRISGDRPREPKIAQLRNNVNHIWETYVI